MSQALVFDSNKAEKISLDASYCCNYDDIKVRNLCVSFEHIYFKHGSLPRLIKKTTSLISVKIYEEFRKKYNL